jgi:hypothetical protein
VTRIDGETIIANVRKGVTVLGAVALLAAGCQKSAPTTTVSSPSRSPSFSPALSVRDRTWRQDIAYLAREVPRVHAGGLTGVSRAAWMAAAGRLERQVPGLTDGQVIVGMERMVAMLHDDETQLILPPSAVYPFATRWIGNGIYLLGVPAADRWLLGARLAAVDGHPVREVVARVRTLIDYQDPGIERGWIVNWGQVSPSWPGYLTDADLLHWLGVTRSATAATFTVVTAHSSLRTIKLAAGGGPAGGRLPRLRYVPAPLYLRHAAEPYWLRILARQRAVYLKYNKCLPGAGFGRLAARALAVLRAHPAYRLMVDLRENSGGYLEPFGPLLRGIWDDRASNVRGRIFGLINDFTASAATYDSYVLRQATNAAHRAADRRSASEVLRRPPAETAASRRAYPGHQDHLQPIADQARHPRHRGGADIVRLAGRAGPGAGQGAGLRPDSRTVARLPRLAQHDRCAQANKLAALAY